MPQRVPFVASRLTAPAIPHSEFRNPNSGSFLSPAFLPPVPSIRNPKFEIASIPRPHLGLTAERDS
jgi:hypothetical protein